MPLEILKNNALDETSLLIKDLLNGLGCVNSKSLFSIVTQCSVIVMDILEVKDLSVSVEGKTILKDVTFSLKSGESHILFGPNGSGKTTLISAIMGLPTYEANSGTIFV